MNTHITFFWDTGHYISTLDKEFRESFAGMVIDLGLPTVADPRPGDYYGHPDYWDMQVDADGDTTHEYMPKVPQTMQVEAEPPSMLPSPPPQPDNTELKERLRDNFRENLRKRHLL